MEWVQPGSIVIHRRVARLQPARRSTSLDHSRVRHSAGEYVVGDAHTNTVEGFFGNLKTAIRGNYKKVSHKWLQGYLNEFMWRRNARLEPEAMFEQLLRRAAGC